MTIIRDMKAQPGGDRIAGACAHCEKAVWESLAILDDCYNVWLGKCPHCAALNFLSTTHGLRGYSSSGMYLVLPTPDEQKQNGLPDGIPLSDNPAPATMHGSPLGELMHRFTEGEVT